MHCYWFSAKLLDFSAVKYAHEGTRANFSCTVKCHKGTILWKIGDYTAEEGNSDQKLNSLGISVQVYNDTDPELEARFSGKGTTVRIGILATKELDHVPIQCKIVPYHNSQPEYSKFTILIVHPAAVNNNTEGILYDHCNLHIMTTLIFQILSFQTPPEASALQCTAVVYLLLTSLLLQVELEEPQQQPHRVMLLGPCCYCPSFHSH